MKNISFNNIIDNFKNDENSLEGSQHLFLIKKLENVFIFKTFDTDMEMAKVEFDIDNLKLIVTSTGLPYNNGTKPVFNFELIDEKGVIQGNEYIYGNENAENFKDILNGLSFSYNETINITFENPSKVYLTNYPIQGKNYLMNSRSKLSFKITKDGIRPNLLQNTIMLYDLNFNAIVFIDFENLNKQFVVESTGNIVNPLVTVDYFVMTLYESDGKTLKKSSIIGRGSNADYFKKEFNNIDFNYGDILKLEYDDCYKVWIKKLLYLTRYERIFKITENGLVDLTPQPSIATLQNAFVFKTYDTGRKMARVEFDIDNLKLIVTSTGLPYNNGTKPVFNFELIDEKGVIQGNEYIYGNENADNFKDILDGLSFSYNEIINITFKDSFRVYLSNYPDERNYYYINKRYFIGAITKQSFKITKNGIIPNVLQNNIMLNDLNNFPIVIIQFDALNENFVINSTGKVTNPAGGPNYFTMTLYESDGITVKITDAISGYSPGAAFEMKFTSQKFNYGDILKLKYEESSKVIITNYPNKGDDPYTPSKNQQSFKITKEGLKQLIPTPTIVKLQNSFIFKTFDTDMEMAKVEFDITNLELIVTSTGLPYNNGSKLAFNFKLIDEKGIVQGNEYIYGNENAENFKNIFDGFSFKYDDSIIITYENTNKVYLTNYPNQGDEYYFVSNMKMKITSNGIIPL